MTNLVNVEKVELRSIVDNYVDILLPSTDIAKRPKLVRDWYAKPQLVAEHGFSALVGVEVKGKMQTVLFDAGLEPRTAVHNSEALGVDLSTCEMLVLSHGQIDHTAGLATVKEKLGSPREEDAHPDSGRRTSCNRRNRQNHRISRRECHCTTPKWMGSWRRTL
jgi:7,8-dihydropterin-6-yl-methyl-4-(beta-D-ribofuranosyl)aminobenzene 5'-phosphate synthase